MRVRKNLDQPWSDLRGDDLRSIREVLEQRLLPPEEALLGPFDPVLHSGLVKGADPFFGKFFWGENQSIPDSEALRAEGVYDPVS